WVGARRPRGSAPGAAPAALGASACTPGRATGQGATGEGSELEETCAWQRCRTSAAPASVLPTPSEIQGYLTTDAVSASTCSAGCAATLPKSRVRSVWRK